MFWPYGWIRYIQVQNVNWMSSRKVRGIQYGKKKVPTGQSKINFLVIFFFNMMAGALHFN